MKKTLVSALTTALVVGAASTTFAAANPFEDVPADHWAYDAVAQLAKDGVVEGYGDGTYVGDAAITRYEMAQMVARAMAKSDLKHADKAMVDKLAAEFADELNNLGVRVAKLEKKVDNLKWDGEVRYRYYHKDTDKNSGKGNKTSQNQLLLRLNLNMEINDHWTGKARIDYNHDMEEARNVDTGITNKAGALYLDRLWVVGKYGNTVIELGKFQDVNQSDYGMTLAYRVSGGKVTFGKDVKVSLAAGRTSFDDIKPAWGDADVWDTSNYMGIEVFNDRAQKFTWGAGYHYLKSGAWENEKMGTVNVGLGYKFDKNVKAMGAYAKNTKTKFADSSNRTSWFVEVDYKGAKKDVKGSWGAYVAYRHVGQYATIYSTWKADNSAWSDNFKGIDLGVNYTFIKNIQGWVKYYNGKQVSDNVKTNAIFTQLDFWF